MFGKRLENLKRYLPIFGLAYRRELKKGFLKLVLILNVLLFIQALWSNAPSMLLFISNIYFLYRYMLGKYPEVALKGKKRYDVVK